MLDSTPTGPAWPAHRADFPRIPEQIRGLNHIADLSVQPRGESSQESKMFRIYEWSFSSTAELAVGVLLIVTILSIAFV